MNELIILNILPEELKDQREKHIKAIQDDKEQLINISNGDDYKNKLLISREREIYKNIYNKRLDKTKELSKKLVITI